MLLVVVLSGCLILMMLFKKFLGQKTTAKGLQPFFLMQSDPYMKLRDKVMIDNPGVVEVKGSGLVFLTHPDTAKEFFHNDYNRAEFFLSGTPYGDLMNDGLAFTNGDIWKRQRVVLAPAFQHNYLANMVPIFAKHAKTMMSKFKENESDIDLKPWLTRLGLDILGSVAFGYDFEMLSGKDGEAQRSFLALATLDVPLLEVIFPFVAKLPTARAAKRKAFSAIIHKTNQSLIDKRKSEKHEVNDLLDIMIKSPLLSLHEVDNNLVVFFIAGQETSVIAMCWVAHYLAKYPEFQQKAYEEVHSVLADRDPTIDDVKQLLFLEMFIKEALRISPPVVNSLTRESQEASEINGIAIPEKTRLAIATYTIHHLPEFWPSPDKFDPSRFSPQNSENRHSFSFLPFGLGKRMCIGNNLAMLEMKVVFALLLRKYEFTYVRDAVKQVTFFMPVDAARVGLKLRA